MKVILLKTRSGWQVLPPAQSPSHCQHFVPGSIYVAYKLFISTGLFCWQLPLQLWEILVIFCVKETFPFCG